MKRSVSDSSNSVPLKRVNSSVSEYDDDEDDQTHYFLRSQNRALAIELGKYKRQILQSRKELDMMRGKSREMEKLTKVIMYLELKTVRPWVMRLVYFLRLCLFSPKKNVMKLPTF